MGNQLSLTEKEGILPSHRRRRVNGYILRVSECLFISKYCVVPLFLSVLWLEITAFGTDFLPLPWQSGSDENSFFTHTK